MKLNQYGHVSPANASKVGNIHTNYLFAINFSRSDIVVEVLDSTINLLYHCYCYSIFVLFLVLCVLFLTCI